VISIADLRSGDPLGEETLAEAITLLGLAADVPEPPPNRLCLHHLCKLRDQQASELLTVILDWWLLVRFGERSNGAAFHLSDELPEAARSVMEALRDYPANTEVPALVGVRHRRAFDLVTERFEASLLHESGQAGIQARVRENIAERYGASLDALKAGATASTPNLSMAWLRQMMRQEGMRVGSDLWRKTEREWTVSDGLCAEAVELSQRPEHAYDGPVPPLQEVKLADRAVGTALAVLLRGVVHVELDVRRVVGDLVETAELAGEEDAGWLALVLEELAEEEDLRPAALAQELHRVQQVRRAIAQLDRMGVDVEMADLYLADGLLSDAEQLVAELREERAGADRLTNLRKRVEQLRPLLARAADDDLDHMLELVEADLADGSFEDAAQRLEAIDGRLESELGERRHERLRDLRARFQQLDPTIPPSLLSLIDKAEDDPTAVTDDEVVEIEDLFDQTLTSGKVRVEAMLAVATAQLDRDAATLEISVREDLEQRLAGARAELDQDAVVTAESSVRQAQSILDRSAEKLWTPEMGESRLIADIRAYARDRMQFRESDLDRLYVGLKSKRFVILSGLTGSGKTTIARLFAESVGATTRNGRFVRVAVRPNWVDETEVLGYVNPLSNRFEPGWLATLLRECGRQPDLPFFCLLDEMNLAPVEYYLADYLSAVEDAGSGAETTTLTLYAPGATPANADEWAPTMQLPDNLFLIGTVNVDESTRALSDRVLDRANVIQLSTTIGRHHHDGTSKVGEQPGWKIRMRDWRSVCATTFCDRHHEFLDEIAEVMNETLRLGMGIRTHLEIERFLANAQDVLSEELALDLALLQRVIPKIRGFRRDLAGGLEELRHLFESVGAERCAAVIADWLGDTTSDDTFVDGSHARVGLVTGRFQ